MNDPLDQDELELLLYLAEELPADRRAAMTRRLAGDASLRARLDALRIAQDSVAAHLAATDRAEPIDIRLRGIERNMSRMLRQWQVDRAVRAAQPASASRQGHRRVPFWLYPLATAAVVLVTLGLWSLTVKQDDGAGAMADNSDDPASQPFYAAILPGGDEPATDPADASDSLATLERDFARYQAINFALQ